MMAGRDHTATTVALALADAPPGRVRLLVLEDGQPFHVFDLTPGEAEGIAAGLSRAADLAARIPAATHAGPGVRQ